MPVYGLSQNLDVNNETIYHKFIGVFEVAKWYQSNKW